MTQYFDHYLQALLRDNVVVGRPRWTNNNCVSVNHVIKQYTQWWPQQLPDLVDKLRDLVRGQYTEADRAPTVWMRWFATNAGVRQTSSHCGHMSATQRQKTSNACLQQTVVAPTSTSIDGTATVPTTPGVPLRVDIMSSLIINYLLSYKYVMWLNDTD